MFVVVITLAAHLRCQGWLIACRGGHTPQQGRYFRTCLGKAEDVIDKQKHVLFFYVTEVLSQGKPGQANPQTGSWRLVHLTENHGRFVNNSGFLHFKVKVVTLTGTLSHAGKDRVAAVFVGNIADQLHNEDGLAHTCTAEKTNFSAPGVGCKEVYNLNPGFQHSAGRLYFIDLRRGAMNWPPFFGLGRLFTVNRLPENIEQTA